MIEIQKQRAKALDRGNSWPWCLNGHHPKRKFQMFWSETSFSLLILPGKRKWKGVTFLNSDEKATARWYEKEEIGFVWEFSKWLWIGWLWWGCVMVKKIMEKRVCGWVCFWEQWNVFVPSNRNRSRDDKVEDCDESEKGKREEYRNMKENRK